jgi:hypothetical protein
MYLTHEEHPEVTVVNFARLADGKIGSDKAAGAIELTLTAFHPPDHRAVA